MERSAPGLGLPRSGGGAAGIAPVAVIAAIAIDAVSGTEAWTPTQAFVAYNLLLVGYLAAELWALRARGGGLLWINPVALASVLTFALPFAVSNVIFLAPDDVLEGLGLPSKPTVWMVRVMLLAVLGAAAMWAGNRSVFGKGLGNLLNRSRVLNRWVVITAVLNPYAIALFLGVSLAARLLKIQLGVFGYGSSYEQLMAGAAYREYLSIADSMGLLALSALAIQCFSKPNPAPLQRYAVWIVTAFEVSFGLLAGFKSAVVMPFVVVGFIYYSQRRRFPRWFLPAMVAAVALAYAVVEPFREARHADAQFDGTSISSIFDALSIGVPNADATGFGNDTALQFLGRMNLTHMAALGVEYEARGLLRDDAPQFLENLLLSPAHALVPRLLWPSKPMENLGAWFNREVQGNDFNSASAMSPIGYLNFAGGILAVLLGFFAVGVLQRGLFDGLRWFGVGGWIVLLGLLKTISEIDSSFNSVVVNVLRLTPMLLVAQYLLLRRPEARAGSSWGGTPVA